jgi:hypothetical protein
MMEGRGTDPSGSRFGKVVGSGGHSNELLGCIKCRKFLSSWASISFRRRAVLHGVMEKDVKVIKKPMD